MKSALNSLAQGVLLVVLATAACGHAPAPVAQRHQTAAAQPSPAAGSPAATPAAHGTAAKPAAAAASATPQATPPQNLPGYPQYAPGSTPAPATATLSAACVAPGGVETLTVVSEPDFVVGFDAQYSDGKDGRTYGGMDSNGRTGPDGTYTSTWVVAPTAPIGQVIVWIALGANNETAFRQPTFKVGRSC